jgi:hypothetical protein
MAYNSGRIESRAVMAGRAAFEAKSDTGRRKVERALKERGTHHGKYGSPAEKRHGDAGSQQGEEISGVVCLHGECLPLADGGGRILAPLATAQAGR